MSDDSSHEIMDVPLDEDAIPEGDVPLDVVRDGLQSDTNLVRHQSSTVAAGLAAKDPERAMELLPLLFEGLEDDQYVVTYQSTVAMSLLAEHEPAAIEPAIGRLSELLSFELPLVQTLAAKALGHVALEHPEYFADDVDDLVEAFASEPTDRAQLDDLPEAELQPGEQESLRTMNKEELQRQRRRREIVANLLVEVAEDDATLLAPHVETLIDLLDDEDPTVVAIAAELIGLVAKADAAPVDAAVEPLCGLLDHDDETVAANAVTALGFIDDAAAVDPLRDLSEDEDRDPDLRDLAGQTADFVAGEA